MNIEEFVARALAARKMGLKKDPYGTLLPDDVWQQMLFEAKFVIETIHAYDIRSEVIRFYNDADDGE